MEKRGKGILACLAIALPSWLLGQHFPVVGGPVIAILLGMVITLFWKEKGAAAPGIQWTSKIILQSAVVFLGFGLDLHVVAATGKQSLPIILATINLPGAGLWTPPAYGHPHENLHSGGGGVFHLRGIRHCRRGSGHPCG